jgi:hypothetical protein
MSCFRHLKYMNTSTALIGKTFKSRSALVVVGMALFLISCTLTEGFGPYEGRVVDAETGEPIEGAAVFVAFFIDRIGPAGSSYRYVSSRETATDENGEFRIPAVRINAFRICATWVYDGHFTIFKPGYAGYGCLAWHDAVKPLFVPNGTLPEKEYVTVELPKLETKEERLKYSACRPTGLPKEDYALLNELLEQNYRELAEGRETPPVMRQGDQGPLRWYGEAAGKGGVAIRPGPSE